MQHDVERIKTFWYTEDDSESCNSLKQRSVSPNHSDISPCINRRCKRLRLVNANQTASPSWDSGRNVDSSSGDNGEKIVEHALQEEDQNRERNTSKHEAKALAKETCLKHDRKLLIEYIQTCFQLKSTLKKVFCHNEKSKDLLNHVTAGMNHACTRVTRMSHSALSHITKEIEALNKQVDCQLKEYQLVGVLWLLTLQQEQQNGILADDMGLGKTAQTVTFLNLAYHSRKVLNYASIILCPPSLLSNWMSELQLWAPQLRCIKYYGTFKDRREALKLYEASCESENPTHILLASYHTVSNRWDRSMLYKMYKFEYLIVDEAHILKNDASRIHQHLKKYVTCQRRLLLTGSPIQNEIAELQSLLSLILCPKFHSQLLEITQKNADCKIYQNILRQAVTPSSTCSLPMSYEKCVEWNFDPNQFVSTISFLQLILSPFILRRLKCQVVTDLPEKRYFIEMCVMEGKQKEMYFREVSKTTFDMGKELLELFSLHNEDKNTLDIDSSSDTCIKNIIFRLRRICNHPLLYKGYYSSDQRKEFIKFHFEMFKKNGQSRSLAQIEDMIESFSDYNLYEIACEYDFLAHLKIDPAFLLASTKIRKMLCLFLDIIEETISIHRSQYNYLRMDGSTPVLQRQGFVNQFSTNDQVKIFLLSTKSSSVGLNLTAASCVILMDQDWNPHNDRQAENRVHRFGQKNAVSIYRLCCKDTLECKILQISNRKLSLDRAFGGTQELLDVEND